MPQAARQSGRITGQQLRALHAIGRKRGLDHEALRDLADVDSLKDLSVFDARALIEQLERGDAPRLRLCNTDHGDASRQQRDTIHALYSSLGWPRAKFRQWLQRRHGISNHYEDALESGQASAIIEQLRRAVAKGPAGRTGPVASDAPVGREVRS